MSDTGDLGQNHSAASNPEQLLSEMQSYFHFNEGEVTMFFPIDMPDMTHTQDQVVIAQAQQKQIDKGIDLHIGACTVVGYPPYPGSGGGISPGLDVHLYYEHVERLNDRYPGNETVTLLKGPQHGILESTADGRGYEYFPDPDYFSKFSPHYSGSNNFEVDQASFLVDYEGKKIQVDTRIVVVNGLNDFNMDNSRDVARYKKLCPSGNYWKINGAINQNGSSSINIDSLEQISVKTEETSTSDNKFAMESLLSNLRSDFSLLENIDLSIQSMTTGAVGEAFGA